MKLNAVALLLASACVLAVAPVMQAYESTTTATPIALFDGTGPTPPPIPMGPHGFDGTGPTPPPIPMGPHGFDGTGPTPKPIPMGPQPAV